VYSPLSLARGLSSLRKRGVLESYPTRARRPLRDFAG